MESIIEMKNSISGLEDIGARLKEARVKGNFTQEEAAKRLGLGTAQTYGHYERAFRQISHIDLKNFCDMTGVRLEWVLTGQEPMMQKDDLNARYLKIMDEQKDIFLRMLDAMPTKEEIK